MRMVNTVTRRVRIEIDRIIIMIVLIVNKIVRTVTRKVEFGEYGHLEYSGTISWL